jgi:hypothetical protein
MSRSIRVVSAVTLTLLGAASVALASNRNADPRPAADYTQKHVPSASRVVREVAGYQSSFYPGFVRRLAVHREGEEIVLFEQETAFVLPGGQQTPWPSNTLEFSGGPAGRDFTMQIQGSLQEIERIEVVFKPGADGKGAERLVIEDGPVLCPPMCPPGGGGD